MKGFLLIIVCFFCQLGMSQNQMIFKGKVVVENGNAHNILVANLSIQKSVNTDMDGNFAIIASPDDLIVFSGNQIEYHRKLLETDDFASEIKILLKAKVHIIEEVEVFNIKGLDAVSLGILSKPATVYTQAERHLYTATNLNARLDAGMMMGGSLSLDPLINWMSGRTKLLKSNLEVENKIIASKKLRNLLEEDFMMDQLQIGEDLIPSFVYFAVEYKVILDGLKANNIYLLKFNLYQIAREFKSRKEKE